MGTISQYVKYIMPYEVWIKLVLILLLLAIVTVLFIEAIRALIRAYKNITTLETKEQIKAKDFETETVNNRGVSIRKLIVSDSIDPRMAKHMIINYGSKEVFVRSFTVAKLPRMVDFATTFASLQNFPNCISSFFIHPLSESAMSAKIDKHHKVLEAEEQMTKDSNRRRRLGQQMYETETLAREIETGRTNLYNAGFLFTIVADSLKDLNRISDQFKSEAIARGIEISNCYALQEEAFLANVPLNSYMGKNVTKGIIEQYISPSAAQFYLLDKNAVSTLYNYTQTSFTHRKGIPLGRDMFTHKPVIYNIYDPSHTSFCGAAFGYMGSGKSATIKEMVLRYRLFGYRYVAIDGQTRKGLQEGEYCYLAEHLGGENFQLSSTSGNVLNIFDISESNVIRKNPETGVLEEKTTLELLDSKTYIVSTLLHIIQGNAKVEDFKLLTYMRKVITDTVTELYNNFEIFNEDASSLYTTGSTISQGALTSGRVRKKMPTLTDFYKLIVLRALHNEDSQLNDVYNLTLASLSDYVKEIYYTERTGKFFTREEYDALPTKVSEKTGLVERYVSTAFGEEKVISIRGTRTYYDGQSTLKVNIKQCPFLNIDLSLLQEDEKPIARIIGMGFLNEHIIKKNSENLSSADKLLVIVDEFHEIIKDAVKTESDSSKNSVLDMCENIIRTARKRNVGMLLCTQTVAEFLQTPQCERILGLLAFSFVFKQAIRDKEIIKKQFGITDTQANLIVDGIGGKDEQDQKAHRGEACLIDHETKKVCFLQMYYFKQVEAKAVETDAAGVAELFKEQVVKGA